MTDTSGTPTDVLSQIEATLSADWQKFVAFIDLVEQDAVDFLSKVVAGEQVLIADIESAASYVAGNLSTINTGINAVGSLAAVVAPNNPTISKVLTDLSTGAQDVADLHNALTSGSSASDPAIVTKAVTAINAVKQLNQLVSNVSGTLTTLVQNSPTATQAVTAGSPPTP